MKFLDFEQPIAELEEKIKELRLVSSVPDVNISEEIARLESKSKELSKSIFKKLSAWQIAQIARHPLRPYALDYINSIFTNFDEIHGDRNYADDRAIVGGLATLNNQHVIVIGQQKGRDTKEKILRNFGMPHPEGYRKALRLMRLAEKFELPIIAFIDTPGAYPGVGAENRGQSEAIARNLQAMSGIAVPIICVVIGEGCSGGALGIGVGDRTLMLQYAYYATISPEGCAAILWKDAAKAADAAEIMGITANRLLELKLIDQIITEPLGGAHRDVALMCATLQKDLTSNLQQLMRLSKQSLLDQRYARLMRVGRSENAVG